METKYKKASKSLARTFFFILHTVEKEKKKLGMDTVEHTASTILVVQIVTKRKDSFYSILELWLFTNHMDFCGCSFVFFSFLFPHKTGGVCKCASAIWTLSGVGAFFFEEEWQVSQEHGQDPLTGPFVCGCGS